MTQNDPKRHYFQQFFSGTSSKEQCSSNFGINIKSLKLVPKPTRKIKCAKNGGFNYF